MPLERDYLFLTEGDETNQREGFECTLPSWFSEIASCFSRSAYIEAEFWGGTGMQAAVVLERSKIILGPEISPAAINSALRKMGVNEAHIPVFGLAVPTGQDPFSIVGLDRHRSVSGWLRDSVQESAAPNGDQHS